MSPSPTSSPSRAAAVASPLSEDSENSHPSSGRKSELLPPETRTSSISNRDDYWSEDASRTLVDAWGTHYLELHRGNLRREHWQEIADAVNAVHAATFKIPRTDVQCKNRIDTIKKKYKIEKSKLLQSGGRYSSTWPHFPTIDSLIGDASTKINNNFNGNSRNARRQGSYSPEDSSSPPPPPGSSSHSRKSPPATTHYGERYPATTRLPIVPWHIPVGPRSKRSVTERNFSVMAAAAAAMEAREHDEADDEDSETWAARPLAVGMKRKAPAVEKGMVEDEGYRKLAEAVSMLGKIYEKVEEAKQRQIVELEKQRMQFARDLEIQRMKVFMESLVQLEKLKRVEHNPPSSKCRKRST